MADTNWQAGGRRSIAAQALLCLAAAVLSCASAQAQGQVQGQTDAFALASFFGPIEPNVAWEIAIGGTVLSAFLGALAFWVHTALRRFKRTQLRHTAYISTALNSLNHGVVMTDPKMRIVYVNDRYLEIYGLRRSDLPPVMTSGDLSNLRRSQGLLDVSVEEFFRLAARPEGLITELPGGRSVHARHFPLPNGGSIATHEDCSEQRKLSRQLASTKQFLESVLDHVPVCVAAKSIEDGRYIFANRAFEEFSRLSRERIVGHRADEIFRPDTAAAVEAADRAALEAPNGHYTTELLVERGRETRVLASDRVIARNEKGDPEFLIALFEDITDRRSLSRELENAKKFLELVVDNIPVSLIVERVSDGRYLLANRSAETIMNRRREEVTGLTAADIFNPREAKLIISRDEAAIKKRGLITEEHPISTKDGLRLFLTRRVTLLDDG